MTKTPLMCLVEIETGQQIEEILAQEKTLEIIASEIGVDYTTVSVWRKRWGIRVRQG